MDVYENLKNLNLKIPAAPKAGGKYVPARQVGTLVYTSGQGPMVDGAPAFTGKLGAELTVQQGREAAVMCILNTLSALEAEIGDLNKVKNVIKVLGFVASAPGFNDQPEVINGGSQLLIDVFGNNGRHARSAIGTNELPRNFPVEIEVIFEIE